LAGGKDGCLDAWMGIQLIGGGNVVGFWRIIFICDFVTPREARVVLPTRPALFVGEVGHFHMMNTTPWY
jgi:hypothetical protein